MLPNREDTAMADITRLVSTGPSAQRVDIVFVAEGYQASERSKFSKRSEMKRDDRHV